MYPLRSIVATTAAAILTATALPSAVSACSICRCGDPTFNALGREGYHAPGLRLALDWERFDKDEGDPEVASESQVENRSTLLASYGFNDRLSLDVRVPFSWRTLESTQENLPGETVKTSGLSDPEIYGQLRLWASRLRGAVGRRSSLSLVAGVKTPWGRNDVTNEGRRVDEHAQPGTGSTDLFGNLVFLYLVDPRSALFVSAGYRHTGENDYGYRYGSSFVANAAYEHKLGARFDGVVELNFRDAEKDRVDASGALDDDTGGALLYLTPRLLADLGHGVVLRAGVQLPVAKNLNGFQKERAVANVGLTYVLSR